MGLEKGPNPEREDAVRQCLKAGMAGLKGNNLDEAIEALEGGLTKAPRSDLLHYYLGKAYERKGRPEDAIESYERAIDTNPDFEDALVCLATLYEQAGMRRKVGRDLAASALGQPRRLVAGTHQGPHPRAALAVNSH